jgi:immunity protein 5 of polymorphic toxin system
MLALSTDDLRAVTAFAAGCAEAVLELFEADRPDDPRPREAITAAWEFARGGERGKALRDTAWAALRAANEADGAPREAARAAMAAAGAAYLHPLPQATQVRHILGAAAHAARAAELAAGCAVGAEHIAQAARRASPAVVAVLGRYPTAPEGGGRVGELIRLLDTTLHHRPEDTA